MVDENTQEVEMFEGCDFLKVRIGVDVSKTLCQGRKITLRSGKESWVSFKYERLSNICY